MVSAPVMVFSIQLPPGQSKPCLSKISQHFSGRYWNAKRRKLIQRTENSDSSVASERALNGRNEDQGLENLTRKKENHFL
jgi:hypothetical protein